MQTKSEMHVETEMTGFIPHHKYIKVTKKNKIFGENPVETPMTRILEKFSQTCIIHN